MTTFQELSLSNATLKALAGMGFEEATPIQEQAIPAALAGKDVIGQAQTGTGKTAAFGIPMIENIDAGSGDIQGIVITPTRELAVQVAEELNRIGEFRGIHTLPIYGGQDIKRQINGLKRRPQIIVGTPGRLVDHMMRRKTISLKNIRTVVLDEADEMLDMGFIEDIEEILKRTPEGRQTLLFSATIPAPIRKLAERFMKDPQTIGIKSKSMTVSGTEQAYYEVPEKHKFEVLCRLLDVQLPALAIVFVRTKRRVDELTKALGERGYPAEGIHGDLAQSKRDSVMRGFKEGTTEVLVATDVAARGLDISGVTHVYNLDIPQDPDSYVHRIGRTGRAGKKGTAITFVTPREMGLLRFIEKITRHSIERRPIPSAAEAFEGKQQALVESLLSVAGGSDISKYRGVAQDLLDMNDSVTLLSAALKMLSKERDNVPETVELTEDRPMRPRNERRRESTGRRDSGQRDYEFRKRRSR
ncbi:putative ATP-dependent RNA helicase [Methanocella paludicola SANAE]|uniref:ATP-dependent RNA helicase n=1 Tax=Methanocella paludicola (strain DSM 17711 / JCM 13418 / NBRC 101707 / SANAE) TaxID=304371 RepID=D1Z0A9_METPS|nr:DEAD/DEAH box helicase [Methanocella paludicola]BAI62131.1 putative ATP-dependent RNA helicase [Methanocella paludicola SANAE]